MDQLTKLKLKLGNIGTEQDSLLNLYLEDAKDTILELTHLSELPQSLFSTQVELAIIYYNKEGIEGQTSHSEGGVSRSFEEGIPKRIMKKIRAARRLPR
ncbi:phage head-tail connector protein [Tissierella sp. Yu-01]|uniref:phage head-tail connector protein n=1 Tax=Tissierella sp. Yu-01 TaxID=3035694 RepID=UPI00240D413D|nr:phage head-tail connector protein [Tissierella sp. Yu-01]WFA10336.1 phage head-tail connector protein [Tissierella sp. Yu-01]